VLEGRRVGVAIPGFRTDQITTSVRRLIALTREPDIQQRCRAAALDLFSLPGGVAAYEGIYGEMTTRKDRAA